MRHCGKTNQLKVINHADVVAEVGRLSALYVRVYVGALKQKPLNIIINQTWQLDSTRREFTLFWVSVLFVTCMFSHTTI